MDKRKSFSPNQNILLFSEVDGICPLCSELLMYEKKKRNHKRYEIAHIYPLNPTPTEKILLKDEEKLSDDLNDLKNLICLCTDCHTKFDKPRTIEDYRKMVALKKKIILKHREKEIWSNYTIESSIIKILQILSSDDELVNYEDDILDYDPQTIDEKTNDTIKTLTKRKIKLNVEEYYSFIKSKFKELDSLQPMSTEVISSQIKIYYLKMEQQYESQHDVFEGVVDWVNRKTGSISKDASEIIVSYFVQNCEVF